MNKSRKIEMTPNIAQLVEGNIKYVYYVLKRFKIPRGEVEEFAQIGKYGLLKAAMTFDKTKGFQFSTYADPCIQNEIGMEFRNRKVYRQYIVVNLEDLSQTKQEELTIASEPINYATCLMDRELIGDIISAIVNCFPYRKKMVMLLAIASWRQEEIAQLLNVTQSYISREIKRCREKIGEYLEKYYVQKQEVWPFQVTMEEAIIKIKFSKERVINFRQVLKNVLYQIGDSMKKEDFTVIVSKKWITIGMPAEAEYLAFIAFLAKEIEGEK